MYGNRRRYNGRGVDLPGVEPGPVAYKATWPEPGRPARDGRPSVAFGTPLPVAADPGRAPQLTPAERGPETRNLCVHSHRPNCRGNGGEGETTEPGQEMRSLVRVLFSQKRVDMSIKSSQQE